MLDAPTKDSPDELPMTVWLTGDEPYFADFSLDTERVMTFLGIKRSRLNQISGRELRVGKARLDRYIRAIYRPCDIDKYKDWTRATATHKKSSAVLDEAKTDLLSCLDKISQSLESSTKEITDSIRQTVRKNIHPLFCGLEDLTIKQQHQLEKTFLRTHDYDIKILRRHLDITARTEEILTKLTAEEPFWLNNLNLDIKKNASNLEDRYNKNIASLKDCLLEQLESINKKLANLTNRLDSIEETRNRPTAKTRQPLHRPHNRIAKPLNAPPRPPSYRKLALRQRST